MFPIKNIKKGIFFLLISGMISACAYRMGYVQNQWFEGYKEIAIPIFKNKTQYGGIEVYFTNFFIEQFEKSKVTKVVSSASSSVLMIGSIEEVELKARGFIDASARLSQKRLKLPRDTVLASNYDVYVKVNIKLVDKKDENRIWERSFNSKESYQAPQIGLRGLNSSNPLYNHRARLNAIKEIAEKLMVEAHDSIVEHF